MTEKKNKGGRPRMLEEEREIVVEENGNRVKKRIKLRDRIVMLIRMGNFPLSAAKACGVSEACWYSWLKQGRDGGDEYFAAFVEEVKSAEGESEAVAVGRIQAAAADPRHWTAAAWFLERKHSDRWAQTVKVEQKVQAEIEQFLDKLQSALSQEEYQRVLSAFVDGEGGEAAAGKTPSH